MKASLNLLMIIIISICSVQAQSFKGEIDSVYHFSPQKLTGQEIEQKSASLDVFWEKIKSDTALYLPQLRYELQEKGHMPFFYYDGSALLLSASRSHKDRKIAASAIAKCDIADLSRRAYIAMLNMLANSGNDVTDAAVKILSDPDYSFFIPQHVMYFNQGYCLSYCLVPLPPKLYVNKLEELLFNTEDIIAQKSIVTTLWFASSCEGDVVLKKAMSDSNISPEVRKYAKSIMSYTKIPRAYKQVAKHFSDEQLVEIRSNSLKRFSDEAISELDLTTRLLRKKNSCSQ